MKVLFITRKFPPSVGGMELLAYDLARALSPKLDLKLVKRPGKGRLSAVLLDLPYLFIKAGFELSKGGVDVIHVQDGVLAPMAYALSKLFRKPYTAVINGLDITYKNRLFKAVVPAAVKRANAVFCISRATADEVLKAGVAESKVHFIPPAVNDELYGKSDRRTLLEKLNLSADAQILLTIGRLVPRKGVAWFVDNVLPELAGQYPKLIYLVAGEGEDRPDVETAIKRHKLENHVRLLGRIDADLRLAAYNGADVFVMPNINIPGDMEGFGLVLLEAALCGRPIVAADTEGIKDAVQNGQNGVLVPPGDAGAYIKEISRLLDDHEYADKFGQSARQFTLQNYQWSQVANRYIELYKTLQSP